MNRFFSLTITTVATCGALAWGAAPARGASAGVQTVGTQNYPNGGMAWVGKYSGFQDEDYATCAIANAAGTTAWIGMRGGSRTGIVARIDLATMSKTGSLALPQEDTEIDSAAIDPAGKYGYFATFYRFNRINLSTFSREGHINMPPPGGGRPEVLLIDPAGKYAYVGLDVYPSRILRMDLASFSYKDSLLLPANESYLKVGAVDVAGTYAYFVAQSDPPRVVKVRLSDFTRVGGVNLPSSADPAAAAIDPSGAYLYVCTVLGLFRIDLGPFTSAESVVLRPGDSNLQGISFNTDGTEFLGIQSDGTAVRYDLLTIDKISDSRAIYSAAVSGILRLPGAGNPILVYNQTAPAIVEKTNFNLQRNAPLVLDGGEQSLRRMVQDVDGRHAIIGSLLGKAIKFDLERFHRVGGMLLGVQGHYLYSAASDGRYAYLGTSGGKDSKSQVAKLDMESLAEPVPRALLGLNSIDHLAHNPVSGLLHLLGTGSLNASLNAGTLVAATLTNFTLTEPVVQQSGFKGMTNMALNPNTGNYYYGNKNNALVVRNNGGSLSYSNPVLGGPLRLLRNTQNWHIYQLSGAGVVYDMDYNTLGFLTSVDLAAVTGQPGPFFEAGAIDGANRFAIYATQNGLIKHSLTSFQEAAFLPHQNYNLTDLMLSPDGNVLYTLDGQFSERTVHRVRLTPRERMEATRFAVPNTSRLSSVYFYSHAAVGPRRVTVEPLGYATNYLRSGFIDRPRNRAWFGAWMAPGRIVSFNTQARTVATSLSLPAGDDNPSCAVMDPVAAFGYFGTYASPAKIIKIRLSDTARVGALALPAGDINLAAAAMDPAGEFAYFGDGSNPGKIIKIRLSDFARVGALVLNAGESFFSGMAVDPQGEFLYASAATGYLMAGVIKIRLSDFTRVGIVPLTAQQNGSLVMDPSGTYLYAMGSYVVNPGDPATPATLDRIRLSDFARTPPSLQMQGDEAFAGAMAVDPNGQFLLAAINAYTPKIIKISIPGLARQGAGNLRPTLEAAVYSILLDSAGEYAYLGQSTSPGRIVTFEVAPKPLRLGLYKMTGSTAAGLVWQSPRLALTQGGQWLSVPAEQGTPATLKMQPGTYALAWQLDADESAPSFALGAAGEGFRVPLPFGSFPVALQTTDAATSWSSTASRWSVYLDYDLETGASGWQDYR